MKLINLKDLSINRSILLFISFIVLFVLTIWTLMTFNFFSGTTNNVVEESSKEINKQIVLNYENYIFDVIDIGNFAKDATLEHTYRNDGNSLEEVFQTIDQSNPYILSISLVDMSGNVKYSSEGAKATRMDLYVNDWFKIAREDKSIFHFSAPHEENIYIGGNRELITVSKVINYYEVSQEYEGVLVIELDLGNFAKVKEVTNLGENGHIIITDENYKTVFTNKIACQDSKCDSIDLMKDKIMGGEFVVENETNMYMNVNTISLTRWRIATFVNADKLSTARNTLIVTFLLAFVVSFAITVLVSSLFSRRITSPITTLNETMKEFHKGSLDSKITVNGQKELVELGDSFNLMVDEITVLMNEVMQEQRAKRKTQFIALQNQINPHFLYNTLDSILHLNDQQKHEEVEEMIVALSKFFRLSISSEKNIIPLREEIEHVKNYLLIQKIRYSNRFDYTINIDEGLLDFKVIKIGLQPLVENAIYHGLDNQNEVNKITISCYEKDNNVYIEVIDSGLGITQERIEEIYENMQEKGATKHIGLRNVSQRMKLYYGPEARIEIESKLEEYTSVKLVYPIKKGDEL